MTNPYSPIRVYIAAPFESRPDALVLKSDLEARGVLVTSTWLTDADGNGANMAAIQDRFHECRTRALKDHADIDAADFLVLLKHKDQHRKPTTGGHHVEVGYAQGTGTPIIIFGDRENVFAFHPLVTAVVDSLADLCRALHVPVDVPVQG